MKLVLTNSIYSTAKETAAYEVVLDAFTVQHLKCINNCIILMFNIFFLNIQINAMILLNMTRPPVLMSESFVHPFNRFIQTADSFRNESLGYHYEWATESINSVTKHCCVLHSLRLFKPHLARHKCIINRRLHWMPLKLESFSRETTCILATVISPVSVHVAVTSLAIIGSARNRQDLRLTGRSSIMHHARNRPIPITGWSIGPSLIITNQTRFCLAYECNDQSEAFRWVIAKMPVFSSIAHWIPLSGQFSRQKQRSANVCMNL